MPYHDVRVPGTNALMFRIDPDTQHIEWARGDLVVVVDLALLMEALRRVECTVQGIAQPAIVCYNRHRRD